MKVVSLFDGMSVGRFCLEKAGFLDVEYHAFEIDKYAIQVSKKNYPDIIRHGDVTTFDFSQLKNVDLLIGGSPCQGFSRAGKEKGFEDPRSKLFWHYVDALQKIKPKYFLLENVVMKKEFQAIITEALGVERILINSALVCAQNRKRLYWCNWVVNQPKDKGIKLKDILEPEVDEKYYQSLSWHKWRESRQDFEKYSAIDPEVANTQLGRHYANWNGTFVKQLPQSQRVYSTEGKSTTLNSGGGGGGAKTGLYDVTGCAIRGRYNELGKTEQNLEISDKPKSNALTSVQKDSLLNDNFSIRKLTPVECERLQGLPDNYTSGVSDSQRYKMLGNGWQADTILHILQENLALYFL